MKNYKRKEFRAAFRILLVIAFIVWVSIPIVTDYRDMTAAQYEGSRNKHVSSGHAEPDNLYVLDKRTSRYVRK